MLLLLFGWALGLLPNSHNIGKSQKRPFLYDQLILTPTRGCLSTCVINVTIPFQMCMLNIFSGMVERTIEVFIDRRSYNLWEDFLWLFCSIWRMS